MLHRLPTLLAVVLAVPLIAGACQGTDAPDPDPVDTGVDSATDTAPDTSDPEVECVIDSECESGVCEGGTCRAPACDDDVQNGDETGVDCGGPCDGCAAGTSCNDDADCTSGRCDGGTCADPTCEDGIANGEETATDCGGPDCAPCPIGQACESDGDCQTSACQEGSCVEPSCMDGTENGAETDLDCGGPQCQPCEPGEACSTDGDCTSGVCEGGSCMAGACDDGVQNGDESDVDCGGPSCEPCATGKSCDDDTDCASSLCGGDDGQTCVACQNGETRTSDEACGPDDRGNVTQECTDDQWADTGCEGVWYESCAEIAADKSAPGSGTYTIDPDGPDQSTHAPREVYCHMERDQGGWTLVAVVSDDGQDHWTMNNRAYWTDDETTFGSLDALNKDYKNEGIQILPMKDILFVHQPSGVWASYHNVSNGKQSLGEIIGAHPYPFCYKHVATYSHSPDRGNITIQGDMCDNELYFNLGDFDGNGEPYCNDLSGAENNAAFGPVWSMDGGDGCPFDDPADAGLGPANGNCADCADDAASTERDSLGWAGPAGLNTGASGAAENFMRIYVR